MRKTHLSQDAGNPAGKNYASHMKAIGHEFKPKDKSIRRQAEKRRTGHWKADALKNKMK